MFISIGKLHYESNGSSFYKLIATVDPEIVRYARFWLNKYNIKSAPQLYAAHISVVRKETPINLEFWGKYQNANILFEYDLDIKTDGCYYWIDCHSIELENIRIELGLPCDSRYSTPKQGYKKIFHITIGNIK